MTKVVTVGIANMAHQGVPPAALGPPVPQQRLLGRTPSPQGRPEPPGESCSCGVSYSGCGRHGLRPCSAMLDTYKIF